MEQQIVGLVALYFVVELVKFFVGQHEKKNGKSVCQFVEKQRRQLGSLHEMHDVKNEDGRPVWYGLTTRQHVELINRIEENSRMLADLIKQMEKR